MDKNEFNTFITIIVLSFILSLKSFANECGSFYAANFILNSVRGYLPSVESMKLNGDHTIKDVESYLKDNLGDEFINALRNDRIDFVTIALGNGPDALSSAKKDGLILGELVEKRVGFHKIRKVTNSKGHFGFLIYRVNGEDREIHIQSFLKMLNYSNKKIITIGENRNWESYLINFFSKLGPPPDLVVYGFAEAATLGLIQQNPISNLKFIPMAYKTLKPKKIALTDEQSDLEGRPLQIITLRTGQKIWLFKNMYGGLAADLMRALSSYGARNFLTLGTAGSLTSKLPVGTIFTPARIGKGDSNFSPISVFTPIDGIPIVGNYEKVDTPNIETKDWLNLAVARGLETIEVELAHLISWAKENPQIKLSSALVISDILVGENHRDMTEWGSSDLNSLRHHLIDIISKDLKIYSKKDLIIKDYKVKTFSRDHL